METSLVLARHGRTAWNAVGRWQGQADPPLDDEGRRQAADLARSLDGTGIGAIVSSDLARAAETACIVGEHLDLPVTEDPRLREIDVGSWSGLTRAEVAERFPEGFAQWQAGAIGHDGETREALAERVVAALVDVAARHPGATVLVVTHGGAIRAARRVATGDPGEPVPNCATVDLTVRDGALAPRGADRGYPSQRT